MSEYKFRAMSLMPYQSWKPYPDGAIVLAYNSYDDRVIAQVKDLWWGYEEDMGSVAEGVLVKAKRLDRPRSKSLHTPYPVDENTTTK